MSPFSALVHHICTPPRVFFLPLKPISSVLLQYPTPITLLLPIHPPEPSPFIPIGP